MSYPTLITDLDNTLYNWSDYFAPSLRGMIHALSQKTKIEEDIFYNEFKRVYSKMGVLEYAFALQEFEVFRGLNKNELDDLINLARIVFNQVGSRNLKLYDGVLETLRWTSDVGIKVIGISNAPFYFAEKRIMRLRAISYFYGLAGWEGEFTEEFLKGVRNQNEEWRSRSALKNKWFLLKNELKPGFEGYKKIIDELNLSPSNIYVIGDSLEKDIKPAITIGLSGIWARYGRICKPENLETLYKVTPWDRDMIAKEKDIEVIKPDFVVDSFSQIKSIIASPQMSLPGFS